MDVPDIILIKEQPIAADALRELVSRFFEGSGAGDCIEYTSLINIRPSQDNRSMVIEGEERRSKVREITFRLVGNGGPVQ